MARTAQIHRKTAETDVELKLNLDGIGESQANTGVGFLDHMLALLAKHSAVEELKSGRQGLEQYRALVERVSRQVGSDKRHLAQLEAKVKAYLKAGDRETAGRFAVELQKAKQQLQENESQLSNAKLYQEVLELRDSEANVAARSDQRNSVLTEIGRSQVEINQMFSDLQKLAERVKQARSQLAAAEQLLRREMQVRSRTAKLPRLRVTSKQQVPFLLRAEILELVGWNCIHMAD